MVLNVSPSGLFVQTTARIRPGDDVLVHLNLCMGEPAIPVRARVVWKRLVAPHLQIVTKGGVGLQIHTAPESYYEFLAGVAGGRADRWRSEEIPEVRAEPLAERFRVRVKQENGPRSRSMVLRCASEEEARATALARTGRGWVILEIERL
jgi:hypothetical protein